jgi:ketosteroid isomerase-like protein
MQAVKELARIKESKMSLEDTIRELKDRVDIQEVMHEYCRHADNLDAQSMVDLFVDDCIACYVPGNDDYVLRGKGQLTKMLSDALAVTVSGSHHIANVEMIFDTPDQVTFYSYMYSWQRFTGYPVTADCHRWGRYEMRWVRTAAGWRISRLILLSAGEYGGARMGEQLGRPFPPTFE